MVCVVARPMVVMGERYVTEKHKAWSLQEVEMQRHLANYKNTLV